MKALQFKKCAIFACFSLLTVTAKAELPNKFVRAIHMTETSGRVGPILGDNGQALGPLQIHRACWIDSGIKGDYRECADLKYATKVMTAYLTRYCPQAVARNDFQTMARVWNGGRLGHKRQSTLNYWRKVSSKLN